MAEDRITHLAIAPGVAFSVMPKGLVHSPLRKGIKVTKAMHAKGKGNLEIFPQFAQEVACLAVGCIAWLLTYRADLEPDAHASTKGRLPSLRDALADPSVRHSHPIRIDQVTIVGIQGLTLIVEGLEAADGSPVLDIQAIKQETD